MPRNEAIQQYRTALKAGVRYYNARVSKNENPYPDVLEDLINETHASGHARIGTIEIPIDQVTGTLAAGRKTAFAGNMMPILPESSEFAQKWISLCEAHLGDTGIRDPITCMEYMGRFYVMEGHKRLSVLKSFDSPTVTATVTRMIPVWSSDPEVQAYYEFMRFYRLSNLYHMQFHKPGQYERLQELLGFDKQHVWTDDERQTFLQLFWRFRSVCVNQEYPAVPGASLSDAILGCLEVYPLEELLKDDEQAIRKKLGGIVPDLRFAAKDEKAQVSTEPEVAEKSLVSKIITGISRPVLQIAFVHAADHAESVWSRGHDEGRKRLEEAFGSQIRVKSYVATKETADEVMESAVKEQAQVIFATAPTLLASARRISALYPGLKVLVCALSVPYTGIRTYYCRLYEAEFVSGAIAGVLSGGNDVGYVARYPILGAPAAINAFALGARMTAPNAKVILRWSCLRGDPVEELRAQGVRVITGYSAAAADPVAWNTCVLEDGVWKPAASDLWNWGKMYQKIVRSILDGGWEKDDIFPAVNYWWGMNSGVMDVKLSDTLPEGVRHLANILRNGLISGTIHPFLTPIRDQNGSERSPGDRWFTPVEIMEMNWLAGSVEGSIPALDELMPFSRETAGLLRMPASEAKEEVKKEETEPKKPAEEKAETPESAETTKPEAGKEA